ANTFRLDGDITGDGIGGNAAQHHGGKPAAIERAEYMDDTRWRLDRHAVLFEILRQRPNSSETGDIAHGGMTAHVSVAVRKDKEQSLIGHAGWHGYRRCHRGMPTRFLEQKHPQAVMTDAEMVALLANTVPAQR